MKNLKPMVWQNALNECTAYCLNIDVDLNEIAQSKEIFGKIALFNAYADTIFLKNEQKNKFIVYDNTIDALYETCKPEILGRRRAFPLVAIVHYLREVIDGKADRSDLESAKRRLRKS